MKKVCLLLAIFLMALNVFADTANEIVKKVDLARAPQTQFSCNVQIEDDGGEDKKSSHFRMVMSNATVDVPIGIRFVTSSFLEAVLTRIFHQISVAIAASLVWALRSWRFRDLFIATTCFEVASLKGLSSARPVCESTISRRN